MKLEFKPEDFESIPWNISLEASRALAASLANAKLNEYIKEHGKVAWCYEGSDFSTGNYLWWTSDTDPGIKKYQAVLINIEEINMQQERLVEDQQKIQVLKEKCHELFGNGNLFAIAFMKALQEHDLKNKPCEHPKEKVQWDANSVGHETLFMCECGARMKPTAFEVVE